MTQYKYFLEEKDMPTHWYNVIPDMKTPPPPYRHPGHWSCWGLTTWHRSSRRH